MSVQRLHRDPRAGATAAVIAMPMGGAGLASGRPRRFDRRDALDAAGSEVFAVAATDPGFVPAMFEDDLRGCSNETGDSSGNHPFVDSSTPGARAAAFADVAKRLPVARPTRWSGTGPSGISESPRTTTSPPMVRSLP